MRGSWVPFALVWLGACGETREPFVAPNEAHGRWNAEQALAFWRQEGVRLERLLSRVDGAGVRDLLGGTEWMARWTPKGKRVWQGSDEDADGDRFPASFHVNLDDLKDAAGQSFGGRYRLSDPDDRDAYAGYSLEFNGLRIEGQAAPYALDGYASLERRAGDFVQQLAIRAALPERRTVFLKSLVTPENMRAPEARGRVENVAGFWEAPGSSLVVEISGEGLVYDWHCGAPPWRQGALVLKDEAGNALRLAYEDCRAKDPVFASKS